MSQINVYAAGGAGINIASEWLRDTQCSLVYDFKFHGLDTSTNNIPKDKSFDVIPMDGARGGGKNRAANAAGAPGYVQQTLSRCKPGDFNIVIFGSSGGSGGLLAPYLVRQLLKDNKPVFCMIITDVSSTKEMANTGKVFKSLQGQVKTLNKPIVYDMVKNEEGKTRRQINDLIIRRLDNLALFLTDIHEEADYQDVFNLLSYSDVTDVPPALTCINFYSQDHIERISGNPVAIMSLFRERDDVFKLPGNYAYRVTGVMEPSLSLPESLKNFHMVLEYDKGVQDLIAIAEEVEDVEIADRNRYKSVETPTLDLNDDAMDI